MRHVIFQQIHHGEAPLLVTSHTRREIEVPSPAIRKDRKWHTLFEAVFEKLIFASRASLSDSFHFNQNDGSERRTQQCDIRSPSHDRILTYDLIRMMHVPSQRPEKAQNHTIGNLSLRCVSVLRQEGRYFADRIS